LIEQRKAKLKALEAKGVFPFRNKFTPTETCAAARGNYVEGREVAVAGRITAYRDMGKSMFIDVRDQSGRIQVYAQKNVIGDEQFAIFSQLDLADFVGVKGTLFITKTGEISIKLASFTILAKALRPPPGKWHGLEDTETRYRQRYLDLISNLDVKDVMLKRSAIIREIRDFLHARGYVEVETPMMQAIPGGAAAQPFKTKHNALGCEFYLRIALELYLKRLLVGGVDRVFEIGRNFRNEGLSRKHNPEFTMLEAYFAYGDYETMMETVESLITTVAQKVCNSLIVRHPRKLETDTILNQAVELISQKNTPEDFERHFGGELENLRGCFSEFQTTPYAPNERPCERAETAYTHLANLNWQIFNDFIMKYTVVGSKDTDPKTIFLSRLETLKEKLNDLRNERIIYLEPKWRRAKYKDLIRAVAGNDWFDVTPAERRRRAMEDLKLAGDIATGYEDFEVTGAVFEKLVEPTLIQPTFVTHLPKELVPLAKLTPDDPTTVEVFECCINGQEVSPGYTEQNDPIEQRERLEHQAGGEQHKLDEDFLVALEHGMPPAGGIGIGIDRLCMMLLAQESIRDVILFPQLKPK
jgi:lysyl-tRNA synthetase